MNDVPAHTRNKLYSDDDDLWMSGCFTTMMARLKMDCFTTFLCCHSSKENVHPSIQEPQQANNTTTRILLLLFLIMDGFYWRAGWPAEPCVFVVTTEILHCARWTLSPVVTLIASTKTTALCDVRRTVSSGCTNKEQKTSAGRNRCAEWCSPFICVSLTFSRVRRSFEPCSNQQKHFNV